MYKVIIWYLIFLSSLCFGQQAPDHSFTIVSGRVLNTNDSILVREWFFEGLKAKATQNNELAGEYFKRVVAADPSNDAALFELANLYFAQNQDKEAERYARGATTVKPANKWYWLLLAEVYKKNNDFIQLNQVFDELIKLEPKEEYYFDKANALLLQNKVDEANLLFNEIEKQFGPSEDLSSQRQRVYLKQGKSEKVIEELESHLKTDPNDIRSYLILSELYANDKNKAKALDFLEKAKSIDPQNAYVRLTLADFYESSGKDNDAFIELKSAFASPGLSIDQKIQIILSYFPKFSEPAVRAKAEELSSIIAKVHPEDAKAFSVYGDVLYQQGKFLEARQSYLKAVKLNSNVYLIWLQLVRIELSLSQFAAAIAHGEEALTLFPNQAELYLFTAIAYNQEKKFEKAITYLKSAASLESEDKLVLAQVYASLGDAFNAVKKFVESDESYDKALQYDGSNSYVLNNYAYYLALRGESLEKAEQMSRRSNELDPNNASFQDTFAWVLFKQQKYKEARIWMERALSNEKSKSGVQVEHYGDILYFLGEKENALDQWKRAVSYGVKSPVLERKINEKKYIE
jgi:tetratricopeptide (TPR) repeat protein